MAEPTDDTAAQPAPVSPAPQGTENAAPVQADQGAAPSVPVVADSSPAAAGTDKPAEAPASLLEEFDAEKAKETAPEKVEPKPGEAPVEAKPAGEKPADVKEPVEPKPVEAAVPVDYFKDVKLPEDIAIDDGQKGDVGKALDAIRAGKVSEGVQQLVGLHEKAMKTVVEAVRSDQWKVFNEMQDTLKKRVMADPVLGGAGYNTAMGAVARMRDLAISSAPRDSADYKAHEQEFKDFLRATGAGNHPAFLRMLHNFARYFDEPPLPPEGARPPPNPGRPAGENRRARMYPSMNGTGR